MSEALNLYRLQELDSQLDRIDTRLKEIEKALSDDRRVRKAQKDLEKAEEESKKIKIELHKIEDTGLYIERTCNPRSVNITLISQMQPVMHDGEGCLIRNKRSDHRLDKLVQ